MDDNFKTNQRRADYLKKTISDETWYKRVETYTATNFDRKHVVHKQKIEQKQANPSRLAQRAAKVKVKINFESSAADYFFFYFNVALAIYNLISVRSGLALWFGSMAVYYTALAFLRFLLLKPKPWPFHKMQVSRYKIRRCQSVVFCMLGGVLPFILFFTMTVFSHSKSDSRIILVFLIYTIFKISAFISKFVTYKMQLVSPWSPINSINHVELMMAILTMLRYWMGIAGDDSFGMVYLLTAGLGIVFILGIIFLGIYAGQRAQEHKLKMDAGIDEEAEYRELERKALEIRTTNIWEKLGVTTSAMMPAESKEDEQNQLLPD